MSSVGFKGFAKPSKRTAETVTAEIGNTSGDEYVLFTGGAYRRRRASGRSRSLATITEKNRPIKLATYIKRASTANPDGTGYSSQISVGGLRLHQGAKPAVYLYLEKDAKGNYRAVTDIPDPDGFEKPFSAGQVVIPAKSSTKAVATEAKS